MSEKKGAPAAAGTTEGANNEVYRENFTAAPPKSQCFILDLLPVGAENAVSAKFLAGLAAKITPIRHQNRAH